MGRLPVVEMIVLDANILIRAVLGRQVRRIGRCWPRQWPCPQAIWTEDTDFFGAGIAVWTSDRIEIFLKEQLKSLEADET